MTAPFLIIGDTHYGVRNDSTAFYDYQKDFNENVMMPIIKEYGIERVFHLGDLVDRRKYINYLTLKRLKDDFVHPILEAGCTIDLTIGNHDVVYKNTNDLNAIDQLFDHEKFKFYTKPSRQTIDNVDVLLLPWVCDDNYKESMEEIAKGGTLAMGHLEVKGFEMNRGTIAEHGVDKSLFSGYHSVLSGHFHHKSTVGNIHYLGSAYQFTWADHGDERGFHVMNPETLEMLFVSNPKTMFEKVVYDDSSGRPVVDEQNYADKYVKVMVKNKENPYHFDNFMLGLERVAHDVQIVEDRLDLDLSEDSEDLVNEAESTQVILEKKINLLGLNSERVRSITDLARDLYSEALQFESNVRT